MHYESLGKAKHYESFKDDFSNYWRVFFMQNKSEVSRCYQTFVNETKNVSHVIKEFLSNGRTELQNCHIRKKLEIEGITFRISMPFTPQ